MSIPFHHPFQEAQFDIFEWYPKAQSCLQHFLSRGQYDLPVQSVAYLVNIRLPFQQPAHTVSQPSSNNGSPGTTSGTEGFSNQSYVALIPYVRRLVVTGFDKPAVLHAFFGDDWSEGVGPMHETERRNYLFAAKSDTWLRVKEHYDMEDGQTVPFLRPLEQVVENEIQSAETNWSAWLAMQDWMLGPRAPLGVPGVANPAPIDVDEV